MTIAESNRVRLAISEESSWAETPSSPTMAELPFSGDTLAHAKQTTNTNTIRSDAQVNANLELGAQMAGDINFELIYSDYETLIKGLMRSPFTTAGVTAGTISFDAATQEIRDSGSGFTTAAGFAVNMWIRVSGAYNSENNGLFRVTTRTDGALTLANGAASIVDEAAGETVTVAGKYVRNGTTNYSFLIEKQFLDVTKYVYYTGCVVGTLALTTTALEVVNGTFGLQGKQGVAMDSTVAGSVTDASTNEQVTASANVGSILIDNVETTIPLRSIAANVDNGLRPRPQVGSKYSSNFGRGSFTVSGTVEAYFEDHTLYNKLIDHTAVELSWRVTDVDGNVIIFTIPEVYLNEGSPNAPGPNDDIILPLNFDAVVNKDTGYDFTLQIDVLSA